MPLTLDAVAFKPVRFGRFLLVRRIAVGGMAELFLARDTESGRDVVLKRILPYLSRESDFVHMFLNEARIAAQLHHLNVVEIYELGRLEGAIFMTMELVAGCDLRRVLDEEQKRNARVPPEIAAWIIALACEGLHYAHNRVGLDGRPLGIVHRDVSPQNVMVGWDGRVKLVDFGVAKASTLVERSRPGAIKGKYLYLAPEQLSATEEIDHRADLFATGSVLYELTTGRAPFQKPHNEAIIYAIKTEDPPPPEHWVPDFPRTLSAVIMKALSKDPAVRHQSAGEIRDALFSYLRHETSFEPTDVVAYLDGLFPKKERPRFASEDTEAGKVSPAKVDDLTENAPPSALAVDAEGSRATAAELPADSTPASFVKRSVAYASRHPVLTGVGVLLLAAAIAALGLSLA